MLLFAFFIDNLFLSFTDSAPVAMQEHVSPLPMIHTLVLVLPTSLAQTATYIPVYAPRIRRF